MTRRRTLCLAVLAAAGIAAVVVARRPRTATPAAAPAATPVPEPVVVGPTQLPDWLPPIDGDCPDGHPVKVNTRSGIFHVPGGRSYDRTVPDRCYATAADAEADGYRRAKA